MKEVILKRTENQHGELVPVQLLKISPEEGEIILQELQCWSAWGLGMGTCRCVSHPTWGETVVSPEKARRLVRRAYEEGEFTEDELAEALSAIESAEKTASELSQRQFEEWRRNPVAALLHYFKMNSQRELEEALLGAYKLGLNPLPQLRKALRELGLPEWEVVWWAGADSWPAANTILVRADLIEPDEEEVGAEADLHDISIEVGEYQPDLNKEREQETPSQLPSDLPEE